MLVRILTDMKDEVLLKYGHRIGKEDGKKWQQGTVIGSRVLGFRASSDGKGTQLLPDSGPMRKRSNSVFSLVEHSGVADKAAEFSYLGD